MDHGVFAGVLISEVPYNGVHVGPVQEFHDLGNAQFIEVDARSTLLAGYLQEGGHQVP